MNEAWKKLRLGLGYWDVSHDARISDLIDLLIAEGVDREVAETAVGTAHQRGARETIEAITTGVGVIVNAIVRQK
jgi:hypothetical protein